MYMRIQTGGGYLKEVRSLSFMGEDEISEDTYGFWSSWEGALDEDRINLSEEIDIEYLKDYHLKLINYEGT